MLTLDGNFPTKPCRSFPVVAAVAQRLAVHVSANFDGMMRRVGAVVRGSEAGGGGGGGGGGGVAGAGPAGGDGRGFMTMPEGVEVQVSPPPCTPATRAPMPLV